MSWFYPLQKLFGYEVGPEDQTEDEELGQLASDLRKRGEQQGFRQPENPVEFRAMAKRKDIARLEELKNRKHLSMKDTDIYVSRQKDPEVRAYQEKAVRKMRLSDAGLKASMFFQDPIMGQVETGLPPNDPRVPTIKSMTRNEKASARTREVVKAIDFFNQSVPVQKRPNQFIGERPSPSDILNKEISRDEEVNRFNWKNFPPMTISVLEDIPSQEYKKGSYTFGAYAPQSKRIEWRKPVTDKEKTAIAHEQLHRFIYEHPAGKPFRHLKGDHELFVRAYTHLLNGGELTDRELAADLLDARGNYKGINIDRFAENVHNYVDAFERAVLKHSTGVEQARIVDGRVVVTPSRIERQMGKLFSSNKKETIVDDLKAGGFKRPEVLAGLLGNIGVETGYTYDHLEKGANNAHGLFGLDFMKPYYDTYLEENNKTDSSLSQIEFVYSTIYGENQNIIGAGNAKKLRKVFEEGTAEEIAQSFMEIWERPGIPHLDRRIKTAAEWLDILNK